jgi:hypothetical protein
MLQWMAEGILKAVLTGISAGIQNFFKTLICIFKKYPATKIFSNLSVQ